MTSAFDGSFEFLPIRSQLDTTAVPYAPTGDDFHLAVSQLRSAEDESAGIITWRVAAARWRVEAIRERRANGSGSCITAQSVFDRVGAALFDWARSES